MAPVGVGRTCITGINSDQQVAIEYLLQLDVCSLFIDLICIEKQHSFLIKKDGGASEPEQKYKTDIFADLQAITRLINPLSTHWAKKNIFLFIRK